MKRKQNKIALLVKNTIESLPFFLSIIFFSLIIFMILGMMSSNFMEWYTSNEYWTIEHGYGLWALLLRGFEIAIILAPSISVPVYILYRIHKWVSKYC